MFFAFGLGGFGLVWSCLLRFGLAWIGFARLGVAWLDLARCETETKRNTQETNKRLKERERSREEKKHIGVWRLRGGVSRARRERLGGIGWDGG